MEGKSDELIQDIYREMDKYSSKKNYERAAIYRDRISALRDIQRSQSIAGFTDNKDAISVKYFQGKVRIGVTSVNGGWVTGHKNFYQSDSYDNEDILESFISQKYLREKRCPDKIVLGKKVENKLLIETALSKHHGKKVSIITKLEKKDKGLMDLCAANTDYVLNKDRSDPLSRSKFKELIKGLEINKKIQWIESYDISHHSGKNAVAGCVVYSANGKEKGLYRSYNISKEHSGNDIGSMLEVIKRRFSGKSLKHIPDLIIIDGGKTHLSQIQKLLKELQLDSIYVISISKGVRRKSNFDSLHIPGRRRITFEKNLPYFNFIQEIRNETHRFAISIQKKKARKLIVQSPLDDLYGVGKVRKKLLLRHFGSVEQLKRASQEDIQKVHGIGKVSAKEIFTKVNSL